MLKVPENLLSRFGAFLPQQNITREWRKRDLQIGRHRPNLKGYNHTGYWVSVQPFGL